MKSLVRVNWVDGLDLIEIIDPVHYRNPVGFQGFVDLVVVDQLAYDGEIRLELRFQSQIDGVLDPKAGSQGAGERYFHYFFPIGWLINSKANLKKVHQNPIVHTIRLMIDFKRKMVQTAPVILKNRFFNI